MLKELEEWAPDEIPFDPDNCALPKAIIRRPSALVRECQRAYDAGLFIAASTLLMTIPDVCSKMIGVDYWTWCEQYMGLPKNDQDYKGSHECLKTTVEINNGLKHIEDKPFTGSDMKQLRNAILHEESSVVEDGIGKNHTPYDKIYLSIHLHATTLMDNFGHTSKEPIAITDGKRLLCAFVECKKPYKEGCPHQCEHRIWESYGFACRINLDVLIQHVAKGVTFFLKEHPECDIEATAFSTDRAGIMDYRQQELAKRYSGVTRITMWERIKEQEGLSSLAEHQAGDYQNCECCYVKPII